MVKHGLKDKDKEKDKDKDKDKEAIIAFIHYVHKRTEFLQNSSFKKFFICLLKSNFYKKEKVPPKRKRCLRYYITPFTKNTLPMKATMLSYSVLPGLARAMP